MSIYPYVSFEPEPVGPIEIVERIPASPPDYSFWISPDWVGKFNRVSSFSSYSDTFFILSNTPPEYYEFPDNCEIIINNATGGVLKIGVNGPMFLPNELVAEIPINATVQLKKIDTQFGSSHRWVAYGFFGLKG